MESRLKRKQEERERQKELRRQQRKRKGYVHNSKKNVWIHCVNISGRIKIQCCDIFGIQLGDLVRARKRA